MNYSIYSVLVCAPMYTVFKRIVSIIKKSVIYSKLYTVIHKETSNTGHFIRAFISKFRSGNVKSPSSTLTNTSNFLDNKLFSKLKHVVC